jgi:hypothetical protein
MPTLDWSAIFGLISGACFAVPVFWNQKRSGHFSKLVDGLSLQQAPAGRDPNELSEPLQRAELQSLLRYDTLSAWWNSAGALALIISFSIEICCK